jgi:hypothetical protein
MGHAIRGSSRSAILGSLWLSVNLVRDRPDGQGEIRRVDDILGGTNLLRAVLSVLGETRDKSGEHWSCAGTRPGRRRASLARCARLLSAARIFHSPLAGHQDSGFRGYRGWLGPIPPLVGPVLNSAKGSLNRERIDFAARGLATLGSDLVVWGRTVSLWKVRARISCGL